MRLINVKAFLDFDIERFDRDTALLVDIFTADLAGTEYAILSHCWGAPAEEVQFKEMQGLVNMGNAKRKRVRQRAGYQKILKCCEQALKDKLSWVWVDTCCINKESSAELSEAINSMFRWYESSTRCYAFLHDINDSNFPEKDEERFSEFNGWPKWFTRGWTLQELIAPKGVQFFNQTWDCIGDKQSLASTLATVTRVPESILKDGLSSARPSVAQIMSWAADRKTTREEDRAYSLLGLLGVYMPMLYGEGKNAFQRLQLETIRKSNDHSIFAWDPHGTIGRIGTVLADDPSFFRDCQHIIKLDPDEFISHLQHEPVFTEKEMYKVSPKRFLTFTVTNGGIEIHLPVAPYRESPSIFRAWLACSDKYLSPMTIDLASSKSNYYRYFGADGIQSAFPVFRQLHMAYQDEPAMRRELNFQLVHRTVSHSGFAFCGIFPDETPLTADQVKVSGLNGRVVLVYSDNSTHARFSVAFGHCFGEPWVHIDCDRSFGSGNWSPQWQDYARKVYDGLWTAPEHTQNMVEQRFQLDSIFPLQINHIHLPQSIWDAVVIYDVAMKKSDNYTIIIDVIQCSGCCGPPMWERLYHVGVLS